MFQIFERRRKRPIIVGASVVAIGLASMAPVADAVAPSAKVILADTAPGVVSISGSNYPTNVTIRLTATAEGETVKSYVKTDHDGSFNTSANVEPTFTGTFTLGSSAGGRRYPTASLDLASAPIGLALYDDASVESGEFIEALSDGQRVDLSSTAMPNIVALAGDDIHSVRFCLDDEPCRIETNAPFELHDNDAPAIWSPAAGRHDLVVSGYASEDGSGSRLANTSIRFSVDESDLEDFPWIVDDTSDPASATGTADDPQAIESSAMSIDSSSG